MSERWLRASALASVVALVSFAVLMWLQHRAAQHSERYAQQLQSWLALESQQSAELLRARAGLVGHYDGIVQTAAARGRALSALLPLPEFVSGAGRVELERLLAQALTTGCSRPRQPRARRHSDVAMMVAWREDAAKPCAGR